MKSTFKFIIIPLVTFLHCCQLKDNNTTKISDTTSDSKNDPITLTDQTILGFWDNFNFNDDSLAVTPDYGEQHFVNFIATFPNSSDENIAKGIENLLIKLSSKPHIQKYFEKLLEKYFYDVNSPFYNEHYYIIALNELIKSNSISKESKERYEILLNIANKNKVGDKATNFTFYASGKIQQLYNIDRDFIILFFYEPTCSSCKQNIQLLKNNKLFNSILQEKATMLAIYPDGNKQIWEENLSLIPKTWINGIDLDMKILKNNLYDLKASPTIYLIDKSKTVLLKDTDVTSLIDYINRN